MESVKGQGQDDGSVQLAIDDAKQLKEVLEGVISEAEDVTDEKRQGVVSLKVDGSKIKVMVKKVKKDLPDDEESDK